MTSPFIPLTRVRALGVVVAWHEGIAIAQRCAEQITPGARAGLDTCAISVTGAVRVGGVSAEPFAHDPLFSLATALVDAANAPPELVAVLSRADVRQMAREDLMRELAFFSRPDAAAAIAAVAARTLAKEAESATEGEFERLRAEVIATPSKSAPVRRRLPSRRVLVAAGGLGALVAAGAAVSTMPWPSTSALAESSPVTTVTTTIDRLLERGLQSLGAPAVEMPAVDTPAVSPPSRLGTRQARAVAASVAASDPVETEHPAPALVDAAVVVDAIIDEEREEAPRRIDTGVYSSQDREVEPPALTHPQLPSPLPEADRASGSYLELLVNEHGLVERVRLRSPHSTLHERMLVSAAKAWRFRPAMKDGQPVKFVARVAVPR
jgi:hypothetical protein